jgi:hypothetical protein
MEGFMMIERKARRQFDANFKLEVARMVKDQGLSVADPLGFPGPFRELVFGVG